jgi:glycosyltransferase involved in cell wall biosynthesis
LATTELPTVVRDGVEGFCATDVAELIERMGELVADPALAARLGAAAHATACERFGIERFCRDWMAVFRRVTGIG